MVNLRAKAIAAYVLTERADAQQFGGAGFHISGHTFDRDYANPEDWELVFSKRLRELRPTYVRLWHHWDWDEAMLEHVSRYLLLLKEWGANVYFTTQTAKACDSETELNDYTNLVTEHMAKLVELGCDNIRHYCMSNELRLYYHGDMFFDMSVFERYHRAFHVAFTAKGLKIGLLATDISGPAYWYHNLRDAMQRMDDVTEGYVAHAYLPLYDKLNHPSMQNYPFDNPYKVWLQNGVQQDQQFRDIMDDAVALAASRNKRFVLGEFGVRGEHGNTWREGDILRDECTYYDTEREPEIAVQLAQLAVLTLNAGAYAACAWALEDYPDAYHPKRTNHWGVYRWDDGFSARASYFGYGLVSRFLRGPSIPLDVSGDCRGATSPGLYIAGIRCLDNGRYSIVAVNRNQIPSIPIALRMPLPEGTVLQKYLYDAYNPPTSSFADMPGPISKIRLAKDGLHDVLTPFTIVVYTNDVPDAPLPAVRELSAAHVEASIHISWQTIEGAIYYRVYRDGKQVASTTENVYKDEIIGSSYMVAAVDSGYIEGERAELIMID
jgi:hypothetical protein